MTADQFKDGSTDWRWFKPLTTLIALMLTGSTLLQGYREFQTGREDKRDATLQSSIDEVKKQVSAVNDKVVAMKDTVTDVRLTVAKIDSSRFKAEDGTKVWEAIADMRRDIAVLQKQVENTK